MTPQRQEAERLAREVASKAMTDCKLPRTMENLTWAFIGAAADLLEPLLAGREAKPSFYGMSIQELQRAQGRLNSALALKVLGDPRKCVTGPLPAPPAKEG